MRKFFAKFFLISFLISFIFSLVIFWVWLTLPSAKEIKGCMITSMYQVNLCPTSGQYVKLSQISPFVKKAVLASEDSLFYNHKGFDWESLQKTVEHDLKKGKFARGGSTITQQLAKNLFLSKDKTLWRKFKEAWITVRIEENLTKSEILEKYLNVVQFGKNIFGVKKASQFYFKKHPSQLTLNESAFLAFLLPSPEKYSISFFRKELTRFARKRMKTIITGLYKAHSINEGVYTEAISSLDYFPNQPSVKVEEPQEAREAPEITEQQLEDLPREDE